MKKALVIALALVMAVGLAACGGETASSPAASPAASPAESAPADASPADSSPADAPATDGAAFDYDSAGAIMKDIYDSGTLKVAMIGNRPPWNFHAMVDGKDIITGFETLMCEGVAQELTAYMGKEITCDFMETDVAGVLAAIQAGKVHVGPGLAGTAERRENMDFSVPYHRSLQCIMIRVEDKDDPKYDLEKGLAGVLVASQLGSSTTVTLKEQYPDCEILDLSSTSDNILALSNGRCEAVVINEKQGILYTKANPDLMLADWLSFDIPVERDAGSCLAFALDNADFREFLDPYVTRILNDGTFNSFEMEAIGHLDDPDLLENYASKNLIETK